VSVSVSPVAIVTLAVSCIDAPNVPDEDADHKVIQDTTSPFVPAQDGHAGSLLAETAALDGDPHVTDSRVVVLLVLDVPADPGSPVFRPA
jgi:hypothetical protein